MSAEWEMHLRTINKPFQDILRVAYCGLTAALHSGRQLHHCRGSRSSATCRGRIDQRREISSWKYWNCIFRLVSANINHWMGCRCRVGRFTRQLAHSESVSLDPIRLLAQFEKASTRLHTDAADLPWTTAVTRFGQSLVEDRIGHIRVSSIGEGNSRKAIADAIGEWEGSPPGYRGTSLIRTFPASGIILLIYIQGQHYASWCGISSIIERHSKTWIIILNS